MHDSCSTEGTENVTDILNACGTCPIRTFMASAVTKFTYAFLFNFS